MEKPIELPTYIKTIQDGEEVEDFSEESDEEVEVSYHTAFNLKTL